MPPLRESGGTGAGQNQRPPQRAGIRSDGWHAATICRSFRGPDPHLDAFTFGATPPPEVEVAGFAGTSISTAAERSGRMRGSGLIDYKACGEGFHRSPQRRRRYRTCGFEMRGERQIGERVRMHSSPGAGYQDRTVRFAHGHFHRHGGGVEQPEQRTARPYLVAFLEHVRRNHFARRLASMRPYPESATLPSTIRNSWSGAKPPPAGGRAGVPGCGVQPPHPSPWRGRTSEDWPHAPGHRPVSPGFSPVRSR